MQIVEHAPDDTFVPLVVIEEMSDQEAREYADSLTPQEAREHLGLLLMEEEE